MNRLMLIGILCISLIGCSSKGIKREDIDQFVEITYGKVVRTEAVTFDSKADEAAAIGGIEGAIENSDGNLDDVVVGAITGAVVSALFVSIEEGSKHGLIVDIKTAKSTFHSLTLKTTEIKLGDCLRVVEGNEVSFKIVDEEFCTL